MKEIQTITIDTINELKARGRYAEAKAQLKAFRDSIQKEKKQLRNEIRLRDRCIKRHLKVCTSEGCTELAYDGHQYCEKHYKYYRKRYLKNPN